MSLSAKGLTKYTQDELDRTQSITGVSDDPSSIQTPYKMTGIYEDLARGHGLKYAKELQKMSRDDTDYMLGKQDAQQLQNVAIAKDVADYASNRDKSESLFAHNLAVTKDRETTQSKYKSDYGLGVLDTFAKNQSYLNNLAGQYLSS